MTETDRQDSQNGGNGQHATNGQSQASGFAAFEAVPKATEPQKAKDFKSDQEVRWCPGCGDYAVLAAFQGFLPELGLRRENMVMISGIGCAARFPYYMDTYGMHGIHGRAPTIATGLASSRPDLSTWVITGDGDALSIGGNHLIHALRRNVNIKILLFNNRIYGLTKGQYSPTSELGKVTKSTPMGSLDAPFNPISLALGAEATFVARAIDSDRKQLTDVLRAAADHQGSSLVEIYQNCNIFNDDAYKPLKDPDTRDHRLVRLEHGEPIRFGADGEKGIRRNPETGSLEQCAGDDPGVLVHDARTEDPSTAFALSRLDYPAFDHAPIGVFRNVARPTYDSMMRAQVDDAIDKRGHGDLDALLASGDTWRVS